MKKFIIGAVAAVVIGLGFSAADASAHWEIQRVQRWAPGRGVYVVTPQRVWVPDVAVAASPGVVVDAAPAVVTPAPVVVDPAPVVVTPAPVVIRPPIFVRRPFFVRPGPFIIRR